VFWTSLSIVGGGVYYKEFDRYSTQSLSIFVCCMVAIFVGVYMLAPSREDGGDRFRDVTMRDATMGVGDDEDGDDDGRGDCVSSSTAVPQSRMRGESWFGSMSMPVLLLAPDEATVDPEAWGKDGGRFSMASMPSSDPAFGAADVSTNSAPLLLGFGMRQSKAEADRRSCASGAV
jgi:hypothetical protein